MKFLASLSPLTFGAPKTNVLLVLEIPQSKSFIFLKDIRASKGPSAVIKNTMKMAVQSGWNYQLKTIEQVSQNLDHTKSNNSPMYSAIIIPKWTNSLESIVELILNFNPCPIIIGPNFHIDHSLCGWIDSKNSGYKTFLIMPSERIRRHFLEIPTNCKSLHKFIEVIPTGIDTKTWNVSCSRRNQVLVYRKFSKTGDDVYLDTLKRNFGDRIKIIEYGAYTQKQYIRLLRRSQALFYFGDTESQGLALLESWACDVPTYVRTPGGVNSLDRSRTSFGEAPEDYAPYLCDANGAFFSSNEKLENIIHSIQANIQSFTPRKWVLENQSLQKYQESISNLFSNTAL